MSEELSKDVRVLEDRIAELEAELNTERSARKALEARLEALLSELSELSLALIEREPAVPLPEDEVVESSTDEENSESGERTRPALATLSNFQVEKFRELLRLDLPDEESP